MKYPNILAAFNGPWAMYEPKMNELAALMQLKAAGGWVSFEREAEVIAARPKVKFDALQCSAITEQYKAAYREEFQGEPPPLAIRDRDGYQSVGRVAIIPVMGVISQRVSMLERSSGGVSTEEIGAALDSAASDKQVSKIVMRFDTPGGYVSGIRELAAKIRNAPKKVIGSIDSMAASAGYWLVSQCSEIVSTPGGYAGSIGVIWSHVDITKALENEGIKVTLIASSKYKTEQYPENALTAEAHAFQLSEVEKIEAEFVAEVAAGRGMTANQVSKRFGQGRIFQAKDAKEAGMVDRIQAIDQLIGRLAATEAKAESDGVEFRARMRERDARAVEIMETL